MGWPLKYESGQPCVQNVVASLRKGTQSVLQLMSALILALFSFSTTVRSRYKRQLIQFKMIKKWPTWSGMEDSRPIFSCKRFSYNENALYTGSLCLLIEFT